MNLQQLIKTLWLVILTAIYLMVLEVSNDTLTMILIETLEVVEDRI